MEVVHISAPRLDPTARRALATCSHVVSFSRVLGVYVRVNFMSIRIRDDRTVDKGRRFGGILFPRFLLSGVSLVRTASWRTSPGAEAGRLPGALASPSAGHG